MLKFQSSNTKSSCVEFHLHQSSNTKVDVRTYFIDMVAVTCVVLSATDDYLIGTIGIVL
jgi:hypothetical protein